MSSLTARLLAATAVLMAASAGAHAGTTATAQPTSTPTPAKTVAQKATYWQRNGCSTFVRQTQYQKALKRSFRFSISNGDFRAAPVKRKVHHRLYEMRECAHSWKARKNMLREHRQRRKRYRWVARIDAITPYGKWAIPPYIVRCESHGSWGAYNPSGASGPYQLLGWGAPMPANTVARQARHHIIAARLWAGGRGASHWVCA